VGGAGRAASGQADVLSLPGHGFGDEQVAGVDGAARGVDVAGIGKLGAPGEVGAGNPERLGPGSVGALPPYFCVDAVQGGDLEGVAVGELLAVGVDPGVEAGADEVTDAGVVAVGQSGLRRADVAELDELGLDPAEQAVYSASSESAPSLRILTSPSTGPMVRRT
jgi:hypothetical protein